MALKSRKFVITFNPSWGAKTKATGSSLSSAAVSWLSPSGSVYSTVTFLKAVICIPISRPAASQVFGSTLYVTTHTTADDGFFVAEDANIALIEFVKNDQEPFESGMLLNMGQWLSIPFVLAGCWFVWRAQRKGAISN